ncbi:MAG: hypothetical protein ACTIJ0_00910 [Glutamicibacter ardleyensis]
MLGVAKLLRFIPWQVIIDFVNGLPSSIFWAHMPELRNVPWMVYPLGVLVVLTAITILAKVAVRTVGDKVGLPDSRPFFHLHGVPLDLDTLKFIAPHAIVVAFIGLLESLLTAKSGR